LHAGSCCLGVGCLDTAYRVIVTTGTVMNESRPVRVVGISWTVGWTRAARSGSKRAREE